MAGKDDIKKKSHDEDMSGKSCRLTPCTPIVQGLSPLKLVKVVLNFNHLSNQQIFVMELVSSIVS